MKLLYFVQYYKPEKASGGILVENLLEGFAKYGWNVQVFTPTPTRGISDEIRKEYKKNKKRQYFFNNKLIINRMSLYREKKGILSRTIRYIIFSCQCLWKGFTEPGEIVFSGSGPPTQGLVCGLISKYTKKKFIYNLQDIFPDSLINAGMCTEKSIFVKIGRCIERFSYKNADIIITISEDMKKNVLSKGVDESKVFMVRNWIDTDKITPIKRKDNCLFENLNLDRNKFYITYAGNLGYVQGVDCLIDVAKAVYDNKNIQFIIFGNGSEETNIKERIKREKLDNILIYPLQPEERISEVYSLGDLSLISCRKGTGGAGMPSKTWLVMSAGTAVLGYFDKNSEFDKIINEANAGICVQSGNIDELIDVVKDLENNKNKCINYGICAREYVKKNISKDKSVSQYINIIEGAINK